MIEEFFDRIEEIELKNHGGCLFFCLVFWRWLKKNNLPTESFDIVQYDSWGPPTKTNIDFINGGSKTASSYHFSWLYDGIEYDSNGPMGEDSQYKAINRTVLSGLNANPCMVEAFCVKALRENSWNPDFDKWEAVDFLKDWIDMSDVV